MPKIMGDAQMQTAPADLPFDGKRMIHMRSRSIHNPDGTSIWFELNTAD